MITNHTTETEKDAQSVQGKRIVISGGTTGIGRATTLLMAKRGAHVLTFGRHEDELNQVLEEAERQGGTVYGLLADVSRKEDILRIFHEVDDKLGGVDILVNNAGLSADSILDSEYDEWQLVINTNVLGYMACCREAVLRMRKKGEGHIINIGSMSADLREEESNVYVATKAAVQGFTEALRKALNKEGISVTLIEPGKVASDLTPPKEEQSEKERRLEMLKPEDIAECVFYCLSQPKRCDVVSVQIRPLMQFI